MNCDRLPNTGLDGSVLMILTVGLLFLLVGGWTLLRTRRSTRNVAATLLLVVAIGGGLALGAAPTAPAYAAPSDCAGPPTSDETQTTTASATAEPTAPAEPTVTSTASATHAPDNSLTITQTSTMDNLAPGVAPADITGLVVNNGPDETFVTAIDVEIVSVTKKAGAAAGTCNDTDYVLADVRMPVDQTLEPDGGSAVFAGASIGFNNKSTNQDACQGATVQLRYSTVEA